MHQQLTRDDSGRSGDNPSPGGRALQSVAAAALLLAMAGLLLMASFSGGSSATERLALEVPPIYRLVYVADETDQRIAVAKQRLITECMASRGFDYTPYAEATIGDHGLSELRPFGLETLDSGTGTPAPPEPPHSEEYARALFGDPGQTVVARGARLEVSKPATGCQADAERRLLGDARMRKTELRLQLYDGEREVREQVDRDPELVEATSRWRACMDTASLDAADPRELLGTLPADTNIATNPATRADVDCKRTTGYLVTAYARLSALQRAWMDAHAGVVTEWTALREREETAARQVLGQG